jgi:hypothetical protein
MAVRKTKALPLRELKRVREVISPLLDLPSPERGEIEMREWQSQAHVKWYCRYHIVIVPK